MTYISLSRITFLLIILVIGFGCSTIRILEVQNTVDFSLSNYKTFDFYVVREDIEVMPEIKDRYQYISAALTEQLGKRGLKRSANNPDLMINVGLVVEEKLQTRETDFVTDFHYMGQRNYHWESEEIVIGEYKEATFSIDFVDAKSKDIKCIAIVQGPVVKKEENSKNNVTVAAEKLFKKIN